MAEEGYSNITNIDLCGLVVKAMVEKYKEKADALKYQQMDVRAMNFNEGYFDAILDKATLDSVLVHNNLLSVAKTLRSMQARWFHKSIESLNKMVCISLYRMANLNIDSTT